MTSVCSEDWGMTDIFAASPILVEAVIQKMQISTRNMMFRSQHQERSAVIAIQAAGRFRRKPNRAMANITKTSLFLMRSPRSSLFLMRSPRSKD
jgi:hypothetical protein